MYIAQLSAGDGLRAIILCTLHNRQPVMGGKLCHEFVHILFTNCSYFVHEMNTISLYNIGVLKREVQRTGRRRRTRGKRAANERNGKQWKAKRKS